MEIKDFVLTQVEVKEIQGRNYAFQYVNFKGTRLPIVGIVSSNDPTFIEYSSKRPTQNSFQLGFSCMSSIQDYFIDLGMILYGLNEVEELNNPAIFDAATFICASHIKKAGRLIDTDMFSYIDLVLIAKNTIWKKLYNSPLLDEEASSLWVAIKEHLFQNLKEFLFLTKYDMSNAMQPRPYLVKYSDL